MSAQHTPGPWDLIPITTHSSVVQIAPHCTVGGIYRGSDSDIISPADARLIAAAIRTAGRMSWHGRSHRPMRPASECRFRPSIKKSYLQSGA